MSARIDNKLCIAFLLLCLSLGAAHAAEGEGKAGREREQLRRVQAALQAEQSKRQGLEAEKAALLSDKEQQVQQTKAQAQSATRALQQQRDKALAEAAALRRELDEVQAKQKEAALAQEQTALQLNQQLAQTRRDNAELRQGNQSLTALLARNSQALTQAQASNRELHALALQALDRWVNKTVAEATLQQEPLLGLARVQMLDTAETMRARIDAQRLQAAATQ